MEAAWSGPAIERSRVRCFSIMTAPRATAAIGNGDALAVVGQADRQAVALRERVDGAQIDLVVGRRIVGRAVQEHDLAAQCLAACGAFERRRETPAGPARRPRRIRRRARPAPPRSPRASPCRSTGSRRDRCAAIASRSGALVRSPEPTFSRFMSKPVDQQPQACLVERRREEPDIARAAAFEQALVGVRRRVRAP